jgi:hypothetical protein
MGEIAIGQVCAERLDGGIAVMVRLDPELVRTMSDAETASLGALLRDAARNAISPRQEEAP